MNTNSNAEVNALLRKFNRRVEKALRKAEKQHKHYKHCRSIVQAEARRSRADEPRRVYPFTVFSAFASLIPALYAKNPEIEIRPDLAAVQTDGETKWADFAQTCEELIHKEFTEATRLKTRMKAALRACMSCGVGWGKLMMQSDIAQDVLAQNRLEDAQDNVLRLRDLADRADDAGADEEVVQEEIKVQTQHVEAALAGETELFVQKGLVLDVVAPEDVLILDENISMLSDYAAADCIAQRVWMGEDNYRMLFGHEAPKGTRFYGGKDEDEARLSDDKAEDERKVQVWEVWDKASGMVYTFALGAEKWAREPYTPTPVGERWYPFFALIFNEVDGVFHPLSDAELLEDYQNEYATMRTDLNNLRRWNKPKFAVSKQGDLSAGDTNRLVQTLRNDDTGDWVAVNTNPTIPLAQQMQQMAIPQVNMSLFDPAMIMRDVEMTTRSGDAARGYINRAKTATEAEIMSMGMQSGISERQDIIEEVMREMALYALQMLAQTYTAQDVALVLGVDKVWEQLPQDVLFRHLALTVKAGSTSKPNKFQEREQWMQLMPVVRETVQQMAQLQAQGMSGMAQALRKMLEETLNRFDERIDLDEFLPDVEQDVQQQMMQQQLAQLQQAGQGVPLNIPQQEDMQ